MEPCLTQFTSDNRKNHAIWDLCNFCFLCAGDVGIDLILVMDVYNHFTKNDQKYFRNLERRFSAPRLNMHLARYHAAKMMWQ